MTLSSRDIATRIFCDEEDRGIAYSCSWIYIYTFFILRIFSGRFDTSGSMIPHSVPEIEGGSPERDGGEGAGLVLEYSSSWMYLLQEHRWSGANNTWPVVYCTCDSPATKIL